MIPWLLITAPSPRDQAALTSAVARVAPSVVTVQTEAVDQAPQDPFDMFFGRAQPRTELLTDGAAALHAEADGVALPRDGGPLVLHRGEPRAHGLELLVADRHRSP